MSRKEYEKAQSGYLCQTQLKAKEERREVVTGFVSVGSLVASAWRNMGLSGEESEHMCP